MAYNSKTDNGAEITNEKDLLAPGGKEGTIPTDLEQSTGLERLEILGKMQGVDIFDMRPLDASRKGAYHFPQYTRHGADYLHNHKSILFYQTPNHTPTTQH